jgi:hypothetical protein
MSADERMETLLIGPHDDRCELDIRNIELKCQCADREDAWLLHEGLTLIASPEFRQTAEWETRRHAYNVRKAALYAYREQRARIAEKRDAAARKGK